MLVRDLLGKSYPYASPLRVHSPWVQSMDWQGAILYLRVPHGAGRPLSKYWWTYGVCFQSSGLMLCEILRKFIFFGPVLRVPDLTNLNLKCAISTFFRVGCLQYGCGCPAYQNTLSKFCIILLIIRKDYPRLNMTQTTQLACSTNIPSPPQKHRNRTFEVQIG